MSAMGGVIPVRSPAEFESGSSDKGERGGVVIRLPIDRPAPVEPSRHLSLELEPISPELALVDPELARAARELLPDRPRFAAHAAVPAVFVESLDYGSEPIPGRRLGRLLRVAALVALGAMLTLLVGPAPPSAAGAVGWRRRALGGHTRHAGPETHEACWLRRSCTTTRRADVRLGRHAGSVCVRVPAVSKRRTHLPSTRRQAAARAPGSLAAGWPALRARAGRLPLVRVARLERDEASVVGCDRPGEAGDRKGSTVIPRRSTVLVAMIAGLLVVGAGAAEGAWWPQRMLNIQRTLAADRVAPTKPSRLTVVSTTASSVTVSWRRSSDRVGVAGYIVYRDGVRIGSTPSTRTRYVASVAHVRHESSNRRPGLRPRREPLRPCSHPRRDVRMRGHRATQRAGQRRTDRCHLVEHHGLVGRVDRQLRGRRLRGAERRRAGGLDRVARSSRSRPFAAARCTRSAFERSMRRATAPTPPASWSRRRLPRYSSPVATLRTQR